jgi:hypothetical protein
VAVCIHIAQSHVKDGELHVAVRGSDIPRAIRLPRSGQAGWGGRFEPITVTSNLLPEQKVVPDEKSVASAVHKILSAEPKLTLLAGLGYYATMFFTIEGHGNAYATTKEMHELPMGNTYRLLTRLVGEGLTFPPTQLIYVELNDWNDIYMNYDIDYIRTYRKIVRWAKTRSPKPFVAASALSPHSS